MGLFQGTSSGRKHIKTGYRRLTRSIAGSFHLAAEAHQYLQARRTHQELQARGRLRDIADCERVPSPGFLWDRYRKWKGLDDAPVPEVVTEPYHEDAAGKEPLCYQAPSLSYTGTGCLDVPVSPPRSGVWIVLTARLGLGSAHSRTTTRWISVVGLMILIMPVSVDANGIDGKGSSTAENHLEKAFDARFNFDVVQVVSLTVRGRTGTLRRTVEMAIKRVGDDLRSVGFFTDPIYLRGTRLLMIENEGREDDFFIYMPSQKRVRRVSTAQRNSSFMGTDLNYEDMERRYVADYIVSKRPPSSIDGEETYVVHARPRYESSYAVLEVFIAASDHAILEIRYFDADRDEPWKIQRTPRESILVQGDYLIPTRIEVEDFRRRSATEVEFKSIQVNPEIADALFSTVALESGREIPFSETEPISSAE